MISGRLAESIAMTRSRAAEASRLDRLEIRPFQPSDSDAVIGLWQSCNLVRPWNSPSKDIARKLLINSEWFLVATLGEEIVGSIMVGYEGHRGSVNYLAVAPGFRREKIGTRLMERAEALLRAVGCPKINLMVRIEGKEELSRFYEDLGFRQDAVICYGKRLENDEEEKTTQ